jgi:alanyl-tRNA synthetase
VTERLYYHDSRTVEFDATVLATSAAGGRPSAVLDRTAFYPTSGGQPFDTGTIDGVAVLDVIDGDDGTVVHVLERDLAPGPVHAQVNWSRRFDHMQQHTGQHVLSAAFDRLYGAATVSFHLGAQASTIDLQREVTSAEIDAAEREANRIVWEDRPVSIRFTTAEEAASLPLRKEPQRQGLLRLIDIEGFDLSACGGTHVARTGTIGVIAVSKAERFRGGSRLEFLCGGRALNGFQALNRAVSASVRALSVLPEELPGAIESLQRETRELRRTIRTLQEQLAEHEAGALASTAEPIGGVACVVRAMTGWDAAGLKALASSVAARPGHLAVLFSQDVPALAVVARGPDVAVDASALLRALIQRFGGKGGGRPELAQGGGLAGPAEALVQSAREWLGTGAAPSR